MKIKAVRHDNRKKAFEVVTRNQTYIFPYAELQVRPSPENLVKRICIDEEFGNEAFTYELRSGEEGTVHIDQVLDYNRDPRYLRDLLLYKLTLLARDRVKATRLSTRELIRRMGTSPAQFYRLLDQTNYTKSIDQLMRLLSVLDCEVDLVVKSRKKHARSRARAGALRSRLVEQETLDLIDAPSSGPLGEMGSVGRREAGRKCRS